MMLEAFSNLWFGDSESFIFMLSIFNQSWKKASLIQKDKSLMEAADLSQDREE